MTRKHFIIFANALREIKNIKNRELILNFLLNVLPSTSPVFNRERFVNWVNK